MASPIIVGKMGILIYGVGHLGGPSGKHKLRYITHVTLTG